MSLASSFATYLQTLGIATIGQDLFISQAPSSNKVPDSIWWVIASGGEVERNLKTNSKMKSYLVEVFYRNRDYNTVYESLHELEEDLNGAGCIQLSGFETVQIEASTFPVDDDLDSEDRKIGLLQAKITRYKEY